MTSSNIDKIPNPRRFKGLTAAIPLLLGIIIIAVGILGLLSLVSTLYSEISGAGSNKSNSETIHSINGTVVSSTSLPSNVIPCYKYNAQPNPTPKILLLNDGKDMFALNTNMVSKVHLPKEGEEKTFYYKSGPCTLFNAEDEANSNRTDAITTIIMAISGLGIGLFFLWLTFSFKKENYFEEEPSFEGYSVWLDGKKCVVKPYMSTTLKLKQDGSLIFTRKDDAQVFVPQDISKVTITTIDPMGMSTALRFKLKQGGHVIFSDQSVESLKQGKQLYKKYLFGSLLSPIIGVATSSSRILSSNKNDKDIVIPLMSLLRIRLKRKITIWQSYVEKFVFQNFVIGGILLLTYSGLLIYLGEIFGNLKLLFGFILIISLFAYLPITYKRKMKIADKYISQ